ncbi:MAG TPA: sigma-70 family RNA polymerase sigma factor [Candidatus Pullichristensenella excrementigallinarum]|uniref:Sigma-70 family RNA polymerase sigma factor n=1 Tax=Candidatus Pullichristensenella excrementigallinarum TaxID=2840907 RepID=A0A9D1LAL4_9FIRM|nr:sigma-70 family RNA polymerase sigma factor [Candidatus Pullichristensenella excrementigallinarum]
MTKSASEMERIYREFRPKIARYVAARIENHADVEDLVSTILLKVFAHLEEYDETKGSLSTWIYAITRNQVIDYYKKRKTLPLPEGYEPKTTSFPAFADEILDELAYALERLPERQRNAVVLFYYAGLSHREIAQKMGITYANARKICSLGVCALKKHLRLTTEHLSRRANLTL